MQLIYLTNGKFRLKCSNHVFTRQSNSWGLFHKNNRTCPTSTRQSNSWGLFHKNNRTCPTSTYFTTQKLQM
jgi:hypothetical protein